MIREDEVQGLGRTRGKRGGELRRALVAGSRPDAEGNPCGANLYPGNHREKRVARFFPIQKGRRNSIFPIFVRMLQVG